MMHNYFIGISISELQQWLADNELLLTRDRVWCSAVSASSLAEDDNLESFFYRLPAFCLDDQAGVVIAEIGAPNMWSAVVEPSVCNIDLAAAKRFIPLTAEARSALAITWDDVIRLDKAIFDETFTRFRATKKADNARVAAEHLASIFIDYGNATFTVDKYLLEALPAMVLAAEQRTNAEISNILGNSSCQAFTTLMSQAFRYTRRLVIDSSDNLKSFVDVGVILKGLKADANLIDQLRAFCTRFPEAAAPSLLDICSDPALSALQYRSVEQAGEQVIKLLSLGLFLRWKQAFHDNRAKVNVDNIHQDVSSLAGKVAVADVAVALWMFGAYLGMEYVAPLYRRVNSKAFPALNTISNTASFDPIPMWVIDYQQDVAEPEAVVGKSDDAASNSPASEPVIIAEPIEHKCEELGEPGAEPDRTSINTNEPEAAPEMLDQGGAEDLLNVKAPENEVSQFSSVGDKPDSMSVNGEVPVADGGQDQPKKKNRNTPKATTPNKKNSPKLNKKSGTEEQQPDALEKQSDAQDQQPDAQDQQPDAQDQQPEVEEDQSASKDKQLPLL